MESLLHFFYCRYDKSVLVLEYFRNLPDLSR